MAKVLIVEDDEQLQLTLKIWLQTQKFTVKAVGNGNDASEQLQFSSFDAIILDWHLPDKDGIEILKTYRSNGGLTPVIMLSGNDTEAERQQGLSSGANEYMKKPFDFKELTERLHTLIDQQ